MTHEWRAVIMQGGVAVAQCHANNEAAARREGAHYLMMYGQDGPAQMQVSEKRNGRWARASATPAPAPPA